ncbi:hypothetical protein [Nocardia jejuensis]|uniref:hypothetical protein n=1 Tax=Nocardia jejuensis TaxID=328049 RepID=UPI0012FCB1AD|nr:hypothetical protein [Nocardia jejuensis]
MSTGTAVAVNMATGGDARWWWWLVVAGLTAVGFACSLWQFLRQSSTNPHRTIDASGRGTVAATGTVTGPIRGGNIASPTPGPAPTAPPVNPAPGSVTASGDGSVAFEGTAESISAGDIS